MRSRWAIFNFSITLLGTTLQPGARWEGVVTAPAGTRVPFVLEELTIVHSGLVRTQ